MLVPLLARIHTTCRPLLFCFTLAGCVEGEGCGNGIGPQGGAAEVNPELCDFIAAVRVPPGAVDHEFEARIGCDVAPLDFSFDTQSSIYEFRPLDLVMGIPAEFRLEYNGGENTQVAWTPVGAGESEWTILPVDVTSFRFGGGEPAVRFEFDRFGYFAVIGQP